MWESLNSAWIEFSNISPSQRHRRRAAAHPRLGPRALGALSRRAAQHDPAQRHLLLQPARHLPRARRQHRAHPRREVLRAAAADRDGRRRRRQRAVGRHPALGLGAPQLPLGLQGELPPVAHRRLPDPQPGDAALAALLLRRDQPGARATSPSSTEPRAPATRRQRRRGGCSPTATSTRSSSRGCTSSSWTSSPRNNRVGAEIAEAYHFNA